MKVGGSPGLQAATQLMQATNQVVRMSSQQVQLSSSIVTDVKANALQHTAQQMSAAVERKGNNIDVMA
jgi:hypothetical protein